MNNQMQPTALSLIDSTLLLKRHIPHYKVKIISDNNGRIQAYLKREGRSCYHSITLKGLSDYLAKETIGKTVKILESSYVKFQGGHLHVMPRGLGGVLPEGDVPECLICPISYEIMETPIVTPCGHTFEKANLLKWIKNGHHTCPTCQTDLQLDQNPNNWPINYAIKIQIDEWQQQKIEPVCPRTLSENPTPLNTAKSNLLLQLAKHYIEQKNYFEAIKQYEEAIKNTDDIEPYAEYVQFLLRANYPLKASKASVYLARCYQKENNLQEAANAYREATQLQPENKDFLEELARHLEKTEEKEEVILRYNTLIEMAKRDGEPFSTLSKYYKKLIELAPNELDHYEAYRNLLKTNGQKAEAKKIKEKILEIQGITWSDPAKMILKTKIEELKTKNAELEERYDQLQASVKRIDAEMKRIVARLNAEQKEQEQRQGIYSRTNQIPSEIESNFFKNAIELLRKNDPAVRSLQCSKIRTAGALTLADALAKNQTLQRLDLQDNQIGEAGALAIAKAIEHNPQISLQYLNLRNNQIGNAGTKGLARALKKNQSLQILDLAVNAIGSPGAQALVQAIGDNPQLPLQQLNLEHNYMTPTNLTQIKQLIERNRNQTF